MSVVGKEEIKTAAFTLLEKDKPLKVRNDFVYAIFT